MSYTIGSGGAGIIKRTQKYTLVMRAARAGSLTVPPAVLSDGSRSYLTEAIKLEVSPGRSAPSEK